MTERGGARGRRGARPGTAPAGRAKAAGKRAEPGSKFIGFAAVVFRIALLVVIFAFLGDWADRSLSSAPWFMVAGMALAIIIVIVAALRPAARERRRRARKRRR